MPSDLALTRRALLAAAAALAAPTIGAAQEATPELAGDGLTAGGYPELRVRVDGDAYALSADRIPAGRTLIVLENASAEESWHGFLVRLPDGTTLDSLQAATPAAGEDDGPPPWLFDALFPGFPGETQPGAINSALVDLPAGEYLIVGDAFQPFTVEASDASPVAAPDPAADAAVLLFEYGFQMPETVTSGRQVWTVTNAGREPHELLLARSSAPLTRDDALALLLGGGDEDGDEGGDGSDAASPGAAPPEVLGVGGVGWLSPGLTARIGVDLEPGSYVVVCFVPDPATFEPHAMRGMVDVFAVA